MPKDPNQLAAPDFQTLAEFYEHMRKAGLVLKKPYELPPLDTIGWEFYSVLEKLLDNSLGEKV